MNSSHFNPPPSVPHKHVHAQGPNDPSVTCREVIEFLGEYIEGRLAAKVLDEFQRHLGECSSCVNYLDAYRRTILLGRSADCASDPTLSQSVPPDLVEAIRAARRRAGHGPA